MGKRRAFKLENRDNLIQLSIDHYFCSGKLTGYKTKQTKEHKFKVSKFKRGMEPIDLDSDENNEKIVQVPVKHTTVKLNLLKSPKLSLKQKKRTPNIAQSEDECLNHKLTNSSVYNVNTSDPNNSIEIKDDAESDVVLIDNDSDNSCDSKKSSDIELITALKNKNLDILMENNDSKYKKIDESLRRVEKLNEDIKEDSRFRTIDTMVGHLNTIYNVLYEPTSPQKIIKREEIITVDDYENNIYTENTIIVDNKIELQDVSEASNNYNKFKTDSKQPIFLFENKTDINSTSKETNFDYNSLEDNRLNLLYKIIRFLKSSPNLYSVYPQSDKEILDTFLRLPYDYQFVIFKLYTRQEKWQRVLQFIEDIKVSMDQDEVFKMMKTFTEQGFILTDYSEEQPVDLLFGLLREEVKAIFKGYNLKSKKTSKPDMINLILKNCSSQTTLTSSESSHQILYKKIRKVMGPCFKLTKKWQSALYRIHLLYSFSNNLIKISDLYFEILEIENGRIVLPKYTCDNAQIFINEDEFLSFAYAREHFDQYSLQREKKDTNLMWSIAETSFDLFKKSIDSRVAYKPKYLIRYSSGSVLSTIITYACEDFANKYPKIISKWLRTMLNQSLHGLKKRGSWYNLLALIAENQSHNNHEAAQILVEGLTDPKVTLIDLHELSQRGFKLLNRKTNPIDDESLEDILKAVILKAPDALSFPYSLTEARSQRSTKSGSYKLFKKSNEDGDVYLRVENVAINYYKSLNYTSGVHCEGSLILTTLYILFWDIIYDSSIPGAFITEIQRFPLDLYSTSFYETRKELIDKQLQNIESEWDENQIWIVIKENIEKYSYCTTPINQTYLENEDVIYGLVMCIGGKILAKIFHRIIKNFRFQSGMPDLFVWNIHTKKYKFVEVKSENDRLSMKQKLWLQYLLDIGTDVEVCYVNSIGSKARKGLKRPIET